MRERELHIFLQALLALKNAAAYTKGDLHALLELCRENEFLNRVWALSKNTDGVEAFEKAAGEFFTANKDRMLCNEFIRGYGKTDLDGQLAYFSLFEDRVRRELLNAEQTCAQKGRLYVCLGLFFGVSAALILL